MKYFHLAGFVAGVACAATTTDSINGDNSTSNDTVASPTAKDPASQFLAQGAQLYPTLVNGSVSYDRFITAEPELYYSYITGKSAYPAEETAAVVAGYSTLLSAYDGKIPWEKFLQFMTWHLGQPLPTEVKRATENNNRTNGTANRSSGAGMVLLSPALLMVVILLV